MSMSIIGTIICLAATIMPISIMLYELCGWVYRKASNILAKTIEGAVVVVFVDAATASFTKEEGAMNSPSKRGARRPGIRRLINSMPQPTPLLFP
jgi:hypothetical protein